MLSPQQLAAIKADILANPDLNGQAPGPDGAGEIAALYNAAAVPDYFVWRTTTPVADVENAINWANLTPADVPDASAVYTNRALACQARQFNLQMLIQGKTNIATGRPNVRGGLQDALTDLPSGAGGGVRAGGWVALKAAISRQATRAEKLLIGAGGGGTAANPGVLGFEGRLTYQDIEQARAL
jgi:hypothetical protein